MTQPMYHEITVRPERRTDSADWWRARCTCGYRSGLHGSPGRAESAGLDHVKAKNGQQR